MEGERCDEVNVLEAAEALPSGQVPQPHGLVHGGAQQEVVLRKINNTFLLGKETCFKSKNWQKSALIDLKEFSREKISNLVPGILRKTYYSK